MRKPKNTITRRRLHYLGVLAAAGLLTFGMAGPVMAFDYAAGSVINTNNRPDDAGAVITGNPGGNVDWDIDATAGTEITNGLHFTSNNDFSVIIIDSVDTSADTTATINSGGIEVTGTGSGTLILGDYTLNVTNSINGGDGSLTISGGTLNANASDVNGTVNLYSATSNIGTLTDAVIKTQGNVTVANAINNASTSIEVESGNFTLSGNMNNGSITTTDGTIALTTVNGGNVTVNESGDGTGTITTINASSANVNVAGVSVTNITGGNYLITLTNSTATTVSGGNVVLGDNSSIGTLSAGDIEVTGTTGTIDTIDGNSYIYGSSGDGTESVTITSAIGNDSNPITVTIGEDSVANTGAVDVIMNSGSSIGNSTNLTTINLVNGSNFKGQDAGPINGLVTVDIGAESSSILGDVIGGTVTANATGENSSSTVGNVSGDTTIVTANATGENSASTVGDVSGGEVTANASAAGSTVTVGEITGAGQVTSDITNGGKGEYDVVSDGGTLTLTVDGTDSSAEIRTRQGDSINNGTLTATVTNGGELNMGNIANGSTADITVASGSAVSVGDVDASTVTATANTGGTINMHDVKGNSTVTADASSGGEINITNVIDSSLTALGNVTVLGANQNVQLEVTQGATVTLDGSYTGEENNVYGADDGGTVPDDYNVVLAATAQIGSNDTVAPKATKITFGESATSGTGSGVTVTDTAGAQIRATNEANGGTTVSFINGTSADLANTSINGGTVAITVNADSSLTGIGDVNAIAGNAVNLTIDNQSTDTNTITAGDLKGLDGESSSLTITNGNLTAGDISGDWNLSNAVDATQTYTSIAGDNTINTNLNLGDGTTIANVEVTGNIGNDATSATININSTDSSLSQTAGDTLGEVNINNNGGTANINNLGDSMGGTETMLAVAGDLAVNGLVYIATVTGSAETGATPGTVNLTQPLDENANLTIGDANTDKALVTVNAVNVTGGAVTVNDGGAFNQTGDITGEFTVTNNTSTDDQITLDTLAGSVLNYGGEGDGVATLAQVSGVSTIANTHTGAGSLNVAATADDSNTTYTGAGATQVAATGNNATNIVQESGNLVLTGTMGTDNVVTINDGSVTFGDTFAPDSAANITELTMDSSNGISSLINDSGSALDLVTDLDATIGDNNVVVNAGSGLTVANINLNGGGSGALEVLGDALLSTAVNVNDASTIQGGLILGTTTAADTLTTATLNANQALTVTGDFTVEDGASAAANPNLNFTAAADYAAQGAAAITVAGNASIAPDTVFTVDNTTPPDDTYKFQVIGGDNVGANDWANLAYIDGNGLDGNGDSHFYDTTNGYYNYFSKAYVNNTVNGAPGFAKDYVNSAFDFNGLLASALGNSSNQELTMAMGNTLNAAFMTINNPLDSIFRNNNNFHERGANGVARDTDCENVGLWITPNLNYRSFDDNYGKGYGGFDIKSYGVTAGVGTCINKQFRLGIFAGLNDSELNGDFQKITSDDIQLGVYGQAVLPADFRINAGFAYIWHDFDARRDVFVTGENGTRQRINSNFDGDTVIAALELNKTFYMEDNLFMRPGVGYTYMGTKLDSYTESSNGAKDWNLAQKVDSTDFDLHLFKVGTDIGWAAENASVVGRAYYVGNAGDKQPKTKAGFAHNPGGPLFNVVGAEYDTSMANLGLTLNVSPGESSHFALSYDTLLGSHTTAHNVSLTFSYEW